MQLVADPPKKWVKMKRFINSLFKKKGGGGTKTEEGGHVQTK